MKNRKQYVMKRAHQLFIDKGFHSTSIQDILDYSGISKGTFYNYFSSKNELFKMLLQTLWDHVVKERDQLLIGREVSDVEVFIQQIECMLDVSSANKLSLLFEEIIFSKEDDMKQVIRKVEFQMLRWYSRRFSDLLGQDLKAYVLDGAVMFSGMLRQCIKYYALAGHGDTKLQSVVRYSVNRILQLIRDAAHAEEQLLQPELLDRWLPEQQSRHEAFQQRLCRMVALLKKNLHHHNHVTYIELLDFIHDELLQVKEPRKFLLESALLSLKTAKVPLDQEQLAQLERMISHYFGDR